MTTKRQIVLGDFAKPGVALRGICGVLNQEKDLDTDRSRELRALIARWVAAPNLAAVLRDDPSLGLDLRQAIERFYFVPSETGKHGNFQPILNPPNDMVPHSFIMWIFASLVMNPLADKLAGPCARCGKYYIKKRESQKVYCSRRCGNAATAIARSREVLEAARIKKLKRAIAVIQKWNALEKRPLLDWKRYVGKRAKIDPKFLTRAVNPKHSASTSEELQQLRVEFRQLVEKAESQPMMKEEK